MTGSAPEETEEEDEDEEEGEHGLVHVSPVSEEGSNIEINLSSVSELRHGAPVPLEEQVTVCECKSVQRVSGLAAWNTCHAPKSDESKHAHKNCFV